MEHIIGNQEEKQESGITLDMTTALKCGKCGGEIFVQATRVRTISALLSPSGKSEVIPLATLICINPECRQELTRESVGA